MPFHTPLLLLLLACASLLPGPGLAADAPAGRLSLEHDGRTRHYLLRIPPQAASAQALPLVLVLVLHGGGGNAETAERMTGFTRLAMRQGFLVAYPEGTGRAAGKRLTWNAGHCCGYALQQKVDDVGFIRALVAQISRQQRVDPQRIYVTGMSNGGMLAHRLGIELSDTLAAIAPVVATLFGDEQRPPHPVSALMINGLLDQSVPAAGGAPGGRFPSAWDGTPAQPALAQLAFWAEADGCTPDQAPDILGQIQRYRAACPPGRAVELYLLQDNGHAWPGGQRGSLRGDRPSTSLEATALIWKFFASQHK